MKFFVTGVNGQLGHDVMKELSSRSYEGIGSDIAPKYSGIQDDSPVTKMPYISLDITDKEAVTRILKETAPDVVVHCAAWTAVDLAEDADKQETVRKINAAGTQYIASACKELDCKMIYLSTDYVFDGQGTTPWKPDCKDYKPLNVYGQTKLLGEQAVANTLEKYFIVRIAWVFGQNGKNFIKTMLTVGKNHDKLTVVNDQIGTPTYTFDLARLLVTPQTKAVISAGTISPKKSSVRQLHLDIQNTMKIMLLSFLSQPLSTACPKQPAHLTADWIKVNWSRLDLHLYQIGKMHYKDI